MVRGKTTEDLLKNLTKQGPQIAVITHGKNYVAAYNGNKFYKT